MKAFSSALLVCFLLAACHKDPVTPTPPTNPGNPTTPTSPAGDSTLSIHFDFPQPSYPTDMGADFELIISQSDGTVLLDTVSPYTTTVNATVKTKQKLVNVAAIYYSSSVDRYLVYVLTAVDPRNWKQIALGHISVAPYPQAVAARMTYTHVPPDPPNTGAVPSSLFGCYNTIGSLSLSLPPITPGYLPVAYGMAPNDYAYLLLPNLGVYNLHSVKSADDTVDMSHPDTARKINFTKPPQYTIIGPSLTAIMDTNNTDRTTLPLQYGYTLNPLADLLVPKFPVQKYLLVVLGNTADNQQATWTTWGDTIPTSLPFPTPADYTINSTQNDNFSVTFHPASPTVYYTSWNAGKIAVNLYASGDSTTLHPLSLLTALKIKKLQGQSLTSLKLSGLTFERVQGKDYPGFLAQQSDSILVRTAPFPSWMSYYTPVN